MLTLATSIQHGTRSSITAIRPEKEVKGIQIGKQERKLSPLANPKEPTKTIKANKLDTAKLQDTKSTQKSSGVSIHEQ